MNTIFRSELQTRYITFHSKLYFLNCSQKDVVFSRRNFRLDPNSQLHHFKDLRFSRYSRLSTAISTSPTRKWIRMNLHSSILSAEIFTLFLMVLMQTLWWTYPWSWSLTLHLHLHHAYIHQPHLWTNKAILGVGYLYIPITWYAPSMKTFYQREFMLTKNHIQPTIVPSGWNEKSKPFRQTIGLGQGLCFNGKISERKVTLPNSGK